MKMMEADKQEKYILLNNDSDLEEFDKSKVSSRRQTQKGKLLSRSHKTKKFSSWDQPQRLCHTFFVLLILISQITLSFFVLKIQQDLSTLKKKGASTQMKASFNIASEQTDVETINSRKEQTESEFKDLTQQQLQNPVGSKLNALEKRLENVTTTLNNLQNRLEEDLDSVFLQLSQLKDNLYVLENTLNITRMGHLNSYIAPTQPFQEKGKKFSTPGLPYVTSSQNYDISVVPEPASQDLKDIVDSEILEEKPKTIISFIKNLTDLQVFFYGADNDANGYLTYNEIASLLGGETPEQEQLELFDADNNEMFSYLELMRAFGLTGKGLQRLEHQ
ncbi:EF-hand calcium-binding domain-containing protein 14-like isoform X4 [Equus caballus]|uniref:EF-hand calcium-binding domain-containing protein 14-like isoform X4 n=1 Tax=Equus caballus TaxID=9796 RepID=UPI0038B23B52